MEAKRDATTYIFREDINNFPFPHKVWLIVNSETCDFFKWNIDGTEFELKIFALDNYLSSPKSIFKIKNRSAFIEHLKTFGFEIMKSEAIVEEAVPKEDGKGVRVPAYSEFVMSFKHKHFLRHRIDLLAKIRRISERIPLKSNEERKKGISSAQRVDGDYGALSNIQKCRVKYQTILNFQSETRILQKKLLASEARSKSKEEDEEDVMIELPAELFENPLDSVLYMGDEHRTGYAGFYGNCSNEQIVKFFGDYLPMYENVEEDASDRRIIDVNPTGTNVSSQSIDFKSNCSAEAAGDTEGDLAEETLTPPATSSSLQPIFTAGDDEEDISMDQFIKFKEQTSDTQTSQPSEDPKVKMDDDEDTENEANFKNFFSQYRESLSLLYEKQ